MELLTGNNITTQFPRLIETANYIIINSQIYDKYTLNPIPFSFYVQNNSNAIIQLSRMIYTQQNTNEGIYSWLMQEPCDDEYSMIVDSENRNRYYQTSQQSTYNGKFQVNEEIVNDNTITIKRLFDIDGRDYGYGDNNYHCGQQYTRGSNFHILFQLGHYVIFSLMRGEDYYNSNPGWSNSIAYRSYRIYRYNKLDNSYNEMTSSGSMSTHMRTTPIISDGMNGYVIKVYNKTYLIQKINVNANTVTNVWTNSDDTRLIIDSNPISVGNDFWMVYDNCSVIDGATIHKYGFLKINLNTTNDVVTQSIIPVQENGFTLDDSANLNWNGITDGVYHHGYSFTKNGITYIVVIIHSLQNFAYYPEQHKMMVFEIAHDQSYAKCIFKERFKTGCKGVIEFIKNDPTVLVTLHPQEYRIYKFNETTGGYDRIRTTPGVFYCIGFDSCGRFYSEDNSYNIETYTVHSAIVLKADALGEL